MLYRLNLILFIFSLIIINAYAENKFYIEPKIGRAKLNLDRSSYNQTFLGKPSKGQIYELEAGYLFNKSFSFGINASLAPKFKYYSEYTDSELNVPTKSNGSCKVQTLIFNSYYNIFSWNDFITPYAGFGVGIAKNTLNNTPIDAFEPQVGYYYWRTAKGASTTNLAWNIPIGALIKINEKLKLDIQYKYSDLGKIKSGSYFTFPNDQSEQTTSITSKIKMQSISLGLRYEF